MKIHPLFAGFRGECPAAVGAALGFDVRVVTDRAPLLPLSPESQAVIESRFADLGGSEGYSLAGSWSAPGVYCVMFARPLTPLALAWWLIGLRGFTLEPRGAAPALSAMPLETLLHGVADLFTGGFSFLSVGYAARVAAERPGVGGDE